MPAENRSADIPAQYTVSPIHNPADEDDTLLYFKHLTHGPINPLHDIPLHPSQSASSPFPIFNMIVEIPRWTNAKLELKTALPLAPIMQDVKKGQKRYVHNVYPYKGYIWNYGCFPQTWEDPTQVHMETGALGDGDPLDVCEIGQEIAYIGQVKQVKVLGVLGMIDEGEMDWKVIAIDVNDRMASELNDIEDLYRLLPGLVHATFSWFRTYKVPDGKAYNKFAFQENMQSKNYALEIIEECHHSWKKIVDGTTVHKNINPVNTTLKNSKFIVSTEKAQDTIREAEAKVMQAAQAEKDTTTLIRRSSSMGSYGDLTAIPLPETLTADAHAYKPLMSIKRFSTELQRKFPHGSNDLSLLITELGVAYKCIRSELCDSPNASWGTLVAYANEQIHASLASTGLCSLIYSSYANAPMPLEDGVEVGDYIVVYNPLVGRPGSTMGSIFSVYNRKSEKGKAGVPSDLLQRTGYEQVAAGYCYFGASTTFTFSMGYGVHSFMLDAVSGHFILFKQHHLIPESGPIFSFDTSVTDQCVDGIKNFITKLEEPAAPGEPERFFRYEPNLVGNFHRVLTTGGILMIPGPQKQNLAHFLAEAAPLAFLARQAGGRASVGKRPLLELSAWSLEMAVPLFVGSNKQVDEVEEAVMGRPVHEKNRVDPTMLMKFEF